MVNVPLYSRHMFLTLYCLSLFQRPIDRSKIYFLYLTYLFVPSCPDFPPLPQICKCMSAAISVLPGSLKILSLTCCLLLTPYLGGHQILSLKKVFWTCLLLPSPSLPSLFVTWIILSHDLCFHSCHDAWHIVCDWLEKYSFCVYLQL